MILLFILFFIFILLLPDLYIYFSFIRNYTLFWQLIFWIPSTAAIVTIVVMGSGFVSQSTLNCIAIIIICLALPKMLFSIISIIGRCLGILSSSIFIFSNYIAFAVLIIGILSTIYGFTFGWKHLQIKEQTLNFTNLPKNFDKYKIVQISDLHLGSFRNNTTFVHKIVETVNSQQADLIVFTGDLVNMSADEILTFIPELSHLKATDGVISILGNHDYCIYGTQNKEQQLDNVKKLKEIERNCGWKLLLNERIFIKRGNDSISIIGVENSGKGNFPKLSNLGKAMEDIDNNTFKILLSHDPSHWQMEVIPKTDIPLTLSGHTHAVQFRIRNFSPASWFYSEWGGLYSKSNQQLYVSTGVGATLPFRLGAWPCIEVLTLRKVN